MNKTLGILAHVDAGKTTLSEQLLFHTGAIRKCGRVDRQDAFLDYNPLERQRGITIFAEQATFSYGASQWFLVDTPGHMDFSAEMERVLSVLDYAIVVVSAVEGVQGHTETIWQLLRSYHIPTFFFINKVDRAGADATRALGELRRHCSPELYDLTDGFPEAAVEAVVSMDEILLERYLEGNLSESDMWSAARKAIREECFFPVYCGSALNNLGIERLLDGLEQLTETAYDPMANLSARVFKIRHDKQGNRVAYLKVLSGTLQVRENINGEKVNELRGCHGEKRRSLQEAKAGELVAVTGLQTVQAGSLLGMDGIAVKPQSVPTLAVRVLFDEDIHPHTMLGYWRILEDEDPQLAVTWEEETGQIRLSIMGAIQLEVLASLMEERFGMSVRFGAPEILYRETIRKPVIGCGHFEPLRHYAEVHLRMEPNPGQGIVFESACSQDVLGSNFQHLIETHVLEKQHRGVLTCSPLTDVKFTLLTGRAHEKHTEGGDFREAAYRAVRQGLEQTESILLEPYDRFQIMVDAGRVGRVLSDLQVRHAVFDPPEIEGDQAVILGRGPVATLMEYPRVLIECTAGRGRINFRYDGYDPCHNAEEVIRQIGYDKVRDTVNVSESVFCSHGVGVVVPWQEAAAQMHCKY